MLDMFTAVALGHQYRCYRWQAVCKKCRFPGLGVPGTGSQNHGNGAQESLCYSGLLGSLLHTTDVGWEPLNEWVPATRSHLQEPRYHQAF